MEGKKRRGEGLGAGLMGQAIDKRLSGRGRQRLLCLGFHLRREPSRVGLLRASDSSNWIFQSLHVHSRKNMYNYISVSDPCILFLQFIMCPRIVNAHNHSRLLHMYVYSHWWEIPYRCQHVYIHTNTAD